MTNQVIEAMKERVYQANLDLPKEGLIKLTWGNVSEINRELGVIVIKPSGVDYNTMQAKDMVVTDLEGHVLDENSMKPSSDLATHVALYQAFEGIHAIVHTHSTNAVKWAQARRDIPAYGTTHADTFYGAVPCTRQLTETEIEENYELNTGRVIIETFKTRQLDPMACPGVVVYGHGPFTWGETCTKAVQNSVVLDEVAEMALGTELLNPSITAIDQYLLDKHYFRKHGANAYYGQG
ncbi:L-ribulose-5-phosphate 4-epimerase [Atopobacter phocae]|uniref:L-ribulose-5-phosphate 4-epimerase n=1 Tax=Atopobacter phocae TaxID=136492 RepID=UPI00046F0C88|nr:L-ribulose-5-phosphate 4-epimerase [Atopobacter phocae]